MSYPANSVPPLATRAVPQVIHTAEDAERERAIAIAQHEDCLTNGLVVAEHNGLFYVVYGKEVYHGFHDYEGGDRQALRARPAAAPAVPAGSGEAGR